MPPGPRASKSCGNCRTVKRRCDKQTPNCGQCIRMRQDCPGYRDKWQLMFHDQTSHTIQRSQGIQSQTSISTKTAKTENPPVRGLSLSANEVGVNYFLHHFVAGGPCPSRGYLNYVPAVHSADGEHPTLVVSMAAVGLAAMASSTRQAELANYARAKYWEAIKCVNSTLASSSECLKDSC